MEFEIEVKAAELVDAQDDAQSSEYLNNSDGQKPVAEKASRSLEIFRVTSQKEILRIRDIAHEFHAESCYVHLRFRRKSSFVPFPKV